MTNYIKLLGFGLVLMASGCEPDDPIVPINDGVLTIETNTLYNGIAANFDRYYTTAAGEEIKFEYVKYFLGDISLFDADNNVLFSGGYALLDPSNGIEQYEITGLGFEADVKRISFSLGIDSATNHADPSTMPNGTALNPTVHQDMYWTWNAGFIFMKNEGKYVQANGDTSNFLYHLGLDENRADFDFPIEESMTNFDRKVDVKLSLDLASVFNDPNVFSIENAGAVSHSSPWDTTMVPILAENLKNAISLQ